MSVLEQQLTAGDKHRARAAARGRAETAAVADIGELLAIENPERKARCRGHLESFLVEYFPHSTGCKPFSADHSRAIARIQDCVLNGGRFVEAVFRGWGKSTIAENASLWALLYGHRKFIPIFGGEASSGERSIDSIKMELTENDLLMEDFPEVCHACRSLEGKPQRCAGQTYLGVRTHIEWTADTVVLPALEGSRASGAIIMCKGITAASRGIKYKRPDGTQQRPDFVFIDDPQTDESANSPLQVEKRLEVIRKNILKQGGHNKRLAVVMAATVIQPDDVVDQLLRDKAWQGERIKMVKKWADHHDDMWMGEYARLRTNYDGEVVGAQKIAHEAATAYYAANKEAMDAGAVVSWEHCLDEEVELSAIQHAYNALIDDGSAVFASEYQNEPEAQRGGDEQLQTVHVIKKSVLLPRALVPSWVTHLTAFIDVGDSLLYGCVMGWADGFRGHVLDYGTFPDQKKAFFYYRDAKLTMQRAFPGHGKEAIIRASLDAFCSALFGHEYMREDAVQMRVNAALIDSGDGDHSDTVYEFCRRSRYAPMLRPSKGRYVGASSAPWEKFPHRKGEVLGHHWLVAPVPKSPATRLVHFDANYWKSSITTGFLTPVAGKRSIELFDGDHRMYADHLTAEYGIKTRGRDREVTEWKVRPGRDNHFLDCTVGCAVGASMLGIKLDIGLRVKPKAKPKNKTTYI